MPTVSHKCCCNYFKSPNNIPGNKWINCVKPKSISQKTSAWPTAGIFFLVLFLVLFFNQGVCRRSIIIMVSKKPSLGRHKIWFSWFKEYWLMWKINRLRRYTKSSFCGLKISNWSLSTRMGKSQEIILHSNQLPFHC